MHRNVASILCTAVVLIMKSLKIENVAIAKIFGALPTTSVYLNNNFKNPLILSLPC